MSLIGCNSWNTLCLYQQDTANHSLITVEAQIGSNDGWAAFGIGKKMVDSPLYVFWKNSAGDCVVSRRHASSHKHPKIVDNQVEEITELDPSVSSRTNGANLKCTIKRPLNMHPSMDHNFIWAIGAGVKDVNDATSNFGKHTIQGKLILNTDNNLLVNLGDTSISTFSIFAILATLLVL